MNPEAAPGRALARPARRVARDSPHAAEVRRPRDLARRAPAHGGERPRRAARLARGERRGRAAHAPRALHVRRHRCVAGGGRRRAARVRVEAAPGEPPLLDRPGARRTVRGPRGLAGPALRGASASWELTFDAINFHEQPARAEQVLHVAVERDRRAAVGRETSGRRWRRRSSSSRSCWTSSRSRSPCSARCRR